MSWNIIFLACSFVYALTLMMEFAAKLLSGLGISARLSLLIIWVGTIEVIFRYQPGVTAFGSDDSFLVIAVLFAATVLGICGEYFFYSRGPFLWRDFLKPLVLSPVVLLPLLGTLKQGQQFSIAQWASTFCLAFQNGFSWRVVVKNAAKNRR